MKEGKIFKDMLKGAQKLRLHKSREREKEGKKKLYFSQSIVFKLKICGFVGAHTMTIIVLQDEQA